MEVPAPWCYVLSSGVMLEDTEIVPYFTYINQHDKVVSFRASIVNLILGTK